MYGDGGINLAVSRSGLYRGDAADSKKGLSNPHFALYLYNQYLLKISLFSK